jgi:hypothetical protein
MKREHNKSLAYVVIQLVNNRTKNSELDAYNPPKNIGFNTYTLEIATNSDDTDSELEQRIVNNSKTFLTENGFETALVHRLNTTGLKSWKITL